MRKCFCSCKHSTPVPVLEQVHQNIFSRIPFRRLYNHNRRASGINTTMETFNSWLYRRHDPTPQADKILPLLAAAGTVGMTRKQIGGAVDLEPEVVDKLLSCFVRSGLVTVGDEDGGRIYRIRPGAGALGFES